MLRVAADGSMDARVQVLALLDSCALQERNQPPTLELLEKERDASIGRSTAVKAHLPVRALLDQRPAGAPL